MLGESCWAVGGNTVPETPIMTYGCIFIHSLNTYILSAS